MNYKLLFYTDENNHCEFEDWLISLRDPVAQKSAFARLKRIESGNFGDHKFERDAIWELRIDVGAGYRIYYSIIEKEIVLLLCGGNKKNKKSQDADISKAIELLNKWKESNKK
jgi:putative addiction module killer protein